MRDYACLMLDYKVPEFITEIQKSIPKEELYLGENENEIKNNTYGIENETHVTICYGLENDVKFEDLKEYLFPINDYKTILVDVSMFDNPNFDVLKVAAKCPIAAKSNKLIMDNFDVHTEYKDFNPHMTIAYLKKGFGEKYKKDILNKIDTIKPYGFNYSYGEDGEDKNEHHK